MRLIDKLQIDLNTVEGIERLINIQCDEICGCPATACGEVDDITQCQAEHLLAEVPTKKVKRWEIYNGDYKKAAAEHKYICRKGLFKCIDQKVQDCNECITKWLMEEVEVADEG